MNQSQSSKKNNGLNSRINQRKINVPGKTGGLLIRRVIQLLNSFDVKRPLDSHILIACSGGVDSTALSHLLIHYGHRILAPEKITLLHINHGWRGRKSDRDENFVKRCAKKWGVGFISKKLDPKKIQKGESWENHAREKRNEIFQKLLSGSSKYKMLFTAHHANDCAETLLWRFCTGTLELKSSGIYFQKDAVFRPFLNTKKEEILKYAAEEKLQWVEDESNEDTDFLRNALRKNILPELTRLFPKFVDHMLAHAMKSQKNNSTHFSEIAFLKKEFEKIPLHLRKNQWTEILKQLQSTGKKTEISLPGQWLLRKTDVDRQNISERWILEKTFQISNGN